MSHIHTLTDYNNSHSNGSYIAVLPPDKDPRPSSERVDNDSKDRSSVIVLVILFVLGIMSTKIGSLAILSKKYSAFSAIQLSSEVALISIIGGTLVSTATGSWLVKKLCHKRKSNDTYHPAGYRLGQRNKTCLFF